MDKTHLLVTLALLAATGPLAAQEGRAPAARAPAAATPRADAAPRDDGRTDTARQDLRREVDEASRAIEAYSVARRDDAVARARTALEKMDARLARLRAAWAREREDLAQDARAARDRADADLRTRRARLETRFDALRAANADAGAEAWARVRTDFVRAYRELGDAVGGGHGDARKGDATGKAAPAPPPAKDDTRERDRR